MKLAGVTRVSFEALEEVLGLKEIILAVDVNHVRGFIEIVHTNTLKKEEGATASQVAFITAEDVRNG